MASFGAAAINKRTWDWDLDLTDEEPEKKRRSISPKLSTSPRHQRQSQAGPSKPKPTKSVPAPTIDLCTPPKKAQASSSRLAVDIWSSSPFRLPKDDPVKPRNGKSIAIDDPISSSAPLPTRGGRPGKAVADNFITIDDSDDDDDVKPAPKPAPSRPSWMDTESEAEEKQDARDEIGISGDSDSDEFPELTSETLKNLPRLTQAGSSKSALSRKGKGVKPPPISRPAAKRAVSEDYAGSKRKPASDRPAAPKKTAEEKAWEKEEKAIQREVEKRRKQDEKDKAKLDRLAEKEKEKALAEVNKIRTDKKISTPEMIVDLPGTLDRVVRLQTEELLKELKVDCTEWTPPLPNAIRWRRKVTSRYNQTLGHWEPRPLTIETEKTAMVILHAQEFVDLATTSSLDAHAASVTRAFPFHNRLYLIEGLDLWFRQNAKHRNRAFAEQVRAGLASGAPVTAALATARRRTNTTTPAAIDESVVRAALIALQVDHSILIHHTDVPLTTSQWIVKFTEFLGAAPYRRIREAVNLASAGFCMESGQVRAGDGPEDTFRRVLQQQTRVTPAMAQGIVTEFRTARKMVAALEERGAAALEHVRKGTNKDGGYTDRTVGPAASRRMQKVWTGRSEGSTDI